MERVHPIHIITLIVAILAASFAFVAMRVAFEARDAAWSAGSGSDGDNWYEISQLQTALIRAGVIEDPAVIPDDHGELDGPWARCLTADERADLGPDAGDLELPPMCETVPVHRDERCPEPVPPPDQEDAEMDDVACPAAYVVDGRRFSWWDHAHPDDVAAAAEEWLRSDGDDGVDRVARGEGATFIHVVGAGWLELYRD